jgi:hypothetical protein
MTKAELFARIEDLLEMSDTEFLLLELFNYFSTDDLLGFYEHLREELEYE